MKSAEWESDSLRWIHRVRENMRREAQKLDTEEGWDKINKNAEKLIKEWGLKVIPKRIAPQLTSDELA